MRSLLLFLVGLFASAEAALPTEDAPIQPIQDAQPIRIFAAASLTDALSVVIADFEKAHPSSRVVPQFGGSSDLARQILAGAPADLFFSADRRQLDRVAREGFIINDDDARADVLSNELVVVCHRDQPDTVDEPKDLEALGRIAMADPEAVPAGVYARQYLESQGLWLRLRNKIVPTLDVRGAMAAVVEGVPEVVVRAVGSWKSEALMRYVSGLIVSATGVRRAMEEIREGDLPIPEELWRGGV